jgi:ABC-type lipoprotein export system ATPase subunit
MKLRKVTVENVRSFKDSAELRLDGDISILIGPNGGGKTNLLDAVVLTLRKHLLVSWIPYRAATSDQPDRVSFRHNENVAGAGLDRHSALPNAPTRCTLDIEVTARDIENMQAIVANAEEFALLSGSRFLEANYELPKTWDVSQQRAGAAHRYVIENGALQHPAAPAALQFQQYLSMFEIDNAVRSALGRAPLSTPMMSMPVNRSGGGFQSSLSLANHEENEIKKAVDAATSRSAGSIAGLAIGRLARQYRLLLEPDTGRARKDFHEQPAIKSLTRVLTSLGYSWDLKCTDPLTNQYTVELTKQGTTFLVGAASSGERELLTFLFAIYALNVTDALILIDEPELHLHPRWQRRLLGTLEELASETRNQFVLATHSPMFISPASIQYVSRVYSEGQASRIVRLDSKTLPDRRKVFGIVNSQNNERMFFADAVILVEGISDRLVLDEVMRAVGLYENASRTIEIVEVGGKGFFSSYGQLLKAAEVPFVTVADLDYTLDVGDASVQALFDTDFGKIAADVLQRHGSKDGAALAREIDIAIQTGDVTQLRDLWTYVGGRVRRLRPDLKAGERERLDAFVSDQAKAGSYILRRGTIESYLPVGYQSKDLSKLLELRDQGMWAKLDGASKEELRTIAEAIDNRFAGVAESVPA